MFLNRCQVSGNANSNACWELGENVFFFFLTSRVTTKQVSCESESIQAFEKLIKQARR